MTQEPAASGECRFNDYSRAAIHGAECSKCSRPRLPHVEHLAGSRCNASGAHFKLDGYGGQRSYRWTAQCRRLNAHGRPAHIGLGAGIGWPEVHLFSSLAGLVSEIYIVACQVVSFTGPADGNLFCGAIAKASRASVFASNGSQSTGLWPHLPYGKIDGFEGSVWKWRPDGSNELTTL